MKQYKAKSSYKDLKNTENFVSLGSASKHIWLLDGQTINYSGAIPEKIKKHLDEIKSSSKDKGAK